MLRDLGFGLGCWRGWGLSCCSGERRDGPMAGSLHPGLGDLGSVLGLCSAQNREGLIQDLTHSLCPQDSPLVVDDNPALPWSRPRARGVPCAGRCGWWSNALRLSSTF